MQEGLVSSTVDPYRKFSLCRPEFIAETVNRGHIGLTLVQLKGGRYFDSNDMGSQCRRHL